jgi:hypothetical protein
VAEAGELWCCPRCELIGSAAQANGHEASTGHDVRKLSAAEEAGVREIWASEGRDPVDGGSSLPVLGAMLTQTGRALAARTRDRFGGGGGLDGPDF